MTRLIPTPVAPRFEAVPTRLISAYWARVEPMIAAAVVHSAVPWTSDDVLARLSINDMQLWLIWRGDELAGVVVSEIYDTGRGRTCALPVAASDDMAFCLGILDHIEVWARQQGCTRLQGEGRAGWERVLKPHGWRVVTTQVEKAI